MTCNVALRTSYSRDAKGLSAVVTRVYAGARKRSNARRRKLEFVEIFDRQSRFVTKLVKFPNFSYYKHAMSLRFYNCVNTFASLCTLDYSFDVFVHVAYYVQAFLPSYL